MSETWTWELSERAADGLEALDADTQQRILDKLDDVVSDEFRDPLEFAKPLTGRAVAVASNRGVSSYRSL